MIKANTTLRKCPTRPATAPPSHGLSAASMRSSRLEFAAETLSEPPRWPWVERTNSTGDLVAEFVLPLDLCQPPNRRRHAPIWQEKRDRDALVSAMSLELVRHAKVEFRLAGAGACAKSPLPGRPMVRAIRFSSCRTDVRSDWAKQAIDVLLPARVRNIGGRPNPVTGLGLIRDDRPSACDVRVWGEFAPPKEGFVLISVFEGGIIK